MRIAFLIEWNAYTSSGVLTKVEAQVREWCVQGHEARVFVVTPRIDGAMAIDLAISTPIFFPFPFRRRQFFNKVFATQTVSRHLRQFGPDVIYYRHSMWYPGQVGNLRHVAPYIVELNSLSSEEFRMRSRLAGAFNAITEPWLLDNAAGFVAVSGEIAQHYTRAGKPVTVVANGFPVTSCEPRPPTHNERPQLLFVGTPGQSWHGLDKITRLAAQLPDCDFHVAGPEASEIPGINGLPNIQAYGYLQRVQLVDLYQRMDIGIGTLALHRKQMEEASPLKVREYVAHGLPVIAGYYDSDLSGSDFFLNIGNTEHNVLEQKDSIRDFIERWRGRTIDHAEVLARVDTAAKETKRLAFMLAVINRHEQNCQFENSVTKHDGY